MSKSWPAALTAVTAAGLLVSCGGAGGPGRPAPPPRPKLPVATSFRASLVGKGMVLVVRNTSPDQTFPDLVVRVRTAAWGDPSNLVRTVGRDVRPGQAVEVGWAELDGWRLEPGESVEIWSQGGTDFEPVSVRVPQKPSGP